MMNKRSESNLPGDAGEKAGVDATSQKSRWFIAALLLLLTAGGGMAAQRVADTQPPVHPVAGPRDIPIPNLHRESASDLVRFEGRLDRGAVHVGSDGLVHLELVATAAPQTERSFIRRPTDVVVVLDRSGSMGGDPLRKALAAVRELIAQLGETDRFALITYSNGAEVAVPLESASSPARARWLSRIDSISAGGGTNMSAGLDRANSLVSSSRGAGRIARVMLLSDGHANQGDASPDGLARRASRALASEYVLSTVGVGEGFDERLMTRLADAGTGNFYYVPHVEVLAGIFRDEFDSARETVASALEIQIDTPGGIEILDAAGYPIEHGTKRATIRPGALFAGQQRSLWLTLRVPADRVGEFSLGEVRLAYQTMDGARRVARLEDFPTIAAVIDETEFVARLDKDAVERQHAENFVNKVRQRVSALVAAGDYAAARGSLDSISYEELEDAGHAREETRSFGAIQELKKDVERAAAAPSSVQTQVRSQLGKTLYEKGTDGRRKGAKRSFSASSN